jgi:prevent-host-death family protein
MANCSIRDHVLDVHDARICALFALTKRELSYKMSYMRKSTISIRELQQNLKRVMARVERGQVIEVTRRRRPIARLAPLRSAAPLSPWPDLDERAHAVFGDRVVKRSPSAIVIENRGDR